MYDIVFISYYESNADKNWELIKSKFPTAKRINQVKGIQEAHLEAAKKCFTKMFWVVDADAVLMQDFDFDYKVDEYNYDTVHVWQSKNPVNGLTYGYGGVKLLPRKMTLQLDTTKTDISTSISDNFIEVQQVSNITKFNTDAFSAWRSGFRECAKLASKSIDRQNDEETEKRLDVWCNVGTNASYGMDTIRGAKAGKKFGEDNKNNLKELANINDFDWLKEVFNRKQKV